MGILRKFVGTEKYSIYVLSSFAYLLLRNFSDEAADMSEELKENLWDLWDWVMWFNLESGLVSEDDFIGLYSSLHRELRERKFQYQKNDQALGIKGQKMYDEFRAILRPHLSTAFLPSSYTSEVWPLIGRPLKHVKLIEGFGDDFSVKIFSVFLSNGVANEENSEIAMLSHLMGQCFIRVLQETDKMERRERLGRRSASFDLIPFFGIFMLSRHKTAE
jgi:hypothetical protein